MRLFGWVTEAEGKVMNSSVLESVSLTIPGKHTLDGLNRRHSSYRIRNEPILFFTEATPFKVYYETEIENVKRV